MKANLSGLSPVAGLLDAEKPITLGNIAAADVNGDAVVDLVIVGTDFAAVPNQIVLVWLGSGDGTFPPAPQQAWRVSTENADPALGLAIADFNADGVLDIAVTDPKIWYFGSDNAGNAREAGTVLIYLGDTTTTYGPFSVDALPPILLM